MSVEWPLNYTVHDEIPDRDAGVVDDGLERSNRASAPLDEVRPLSCFARVGSGAVVGGVVGRTWGECCEIQQLWVAPDYRRRGVATRLVQQVEDHARSRGCRLVFLETFSFQAPSLYEKLGYRVELELTGFAPGVCKYTMVRRLGG